MSEQLSDEKTVVIADVHGQSKLLRQVEKHYGDSVDRYVFAGDMINRGPDSAGVLDIAKSLGATTLLGNHEMFLLVGLLCEDPDIKRDIRDAVTTFKQKDAVLLARSYGASEKGSRYDMIENIGESMRKAGHLGMLARSALYFEGKDFVAVHAGLTDTGLLLQKQEMFYAQKAMSSGGIAEPQQLTSFELAHQQEAFKATSKTVVTGHAHNISGDRITAGGKRVRLASNLAANQPLHVWQSWDQAIKMFAQ